MIMSFQHERGRGATRTWLLCCAVFVLSSLIAVAEAEEGIVIAADDVGLKNLQDWRLVR